MPEKQTIEKARADKRAGKSASTQAGEFVREEIDRIRRGEHGARNTKQAIAIGPSEARRASVDLPPPRKSATSKRTRRNAKLAYGAGQGEEAGAPSRCVQIHLRGVEAGAPQHGLALRAVEAGEERGCTPRQERPLRRREEGRTDEGRGRPLSRSQEGGPDEGAPLPLVLL
jgi:hypothetical protein